MANSVGSQPIRNVSMQAEMPPLRAGGLLGIGETSRALSDASYETDNVFVAVADASLTKTSADSRHVASCRPVSGAFLHSNDERFVGLVPTAR